MRLRKLILGLAVAAFAAAPAIADAPDRKFNVKTSETGVKYISGGVGNQEAAAMERKFGQYSFKLVNVRNQGQGAYVSNVNVTIKNAAGDVVVQDTTKGPWLLADLEAGTYTLNADFNQQKRKRKFTVDEGGQERRVLKWNAKDQANQEPSGDTSLKEVVPASAVDKKAAAGANASADTKADAKAKSGSKKEHPGKSKSAEHPGEGAGEEHPGQ